VGFDSERRRVGTERAVTTPYIRAMRVIRARARCQSFYVVCFYRTWVWIHQRKDLKNTNQKTAKKNLIQS
jgi:hypothetical protein